MKFLIRNSKDIRSTPTSHNKDIIKSILVSNNEVKNLLQFAKAVLNKGDVIDNHYHLSMDEIFYINYGKIKLFVDDMCYNLAAGDVFVIYANTNHSLHIIENSEIIYFGIKV